MTRDDIIKMAREAGFNPVSYMGANLESFERFAALVAAHEREWVGLTDDEVAIICGECAASAHKTDDISYARAIEAKLKEKNHG